MMVVESQQSGPTNQDVFAIFGFVRERVYFTFEAFEAVVDGFSRDSSIPGRRRVLRTPPSFCLSKGGAASFYSSRVIRIRIY